jgi:dihydrofolate synthase/folylpolyglutamate synthase
MTYQETTTWLFNQLPMFQMQGASAYKKDLTNTLLLVEHLQHPEIKFKSIHVAGTNGKGSTSSMIASILQEAGYKVGLYTSPHLKDFRERIRINGEMISEDFADSSC